MKIDSKPKRIAAMIVIGLVVGILLMALGVPPKLTSTLTAVLLFFVWIWLGGKWW